MNAIWGNSTHQSSYGGAHPISQNPFLSLALEKVPFVRADLTPTATKTCALPSISRIIIAKIVNIIHSNVMCCKNWTKLNHIHDHLCKVPLPTPLSSPPCQWNAQSSSSMSQCHICWQAGNEMRWWGGWWEWLILPAEKFSASLINWLTRFIRRSINNRGSAGRQPMFVHSSFLMDLPPSAPSPPPHKRNFRRGRQFFRPFIVTWPEQVFFFYLIYE